MSALTVLKVAEAALLAENEKPAYRGISEYCGRAQVPNHGVAQQVDLAVVLHPEVLFGNIYEKENYRRIL